MAGKLWDPALVFGKDYVAKVKVDWSTNVLERNRQMMERLLDVDPTSYDPNVPKPDTANENYLHWLLDEGVCQVLVSFLLRSAESRKGDQISRSKERPLGEEKPTRRSYHLMKLFLSWDKYFSSFVKKKLPVIADEMFKILDPTSVGNLFHFHKIVEVLLRVCDYPFMDLIISKGWIFKMIDYIHEPAVADCATRVLACKFAHLDYRKLYYKELERGEFWGVLGRKVYLKENADISTYAVNFMGKIYDELAPLEGTEEFFEQILINNNELANGLLKAIKDSSYSLPHQTECAHALRLLVYQSGEKFFETKPAPNEKEFVTIELPNMLSVIRPKLLTHVKPHVAEIFAVLDNLIKVTTPVALVPSITFSSYQVPQPFTFYRLLLVEILTEMVVFSPAEGLNLLPLSAWDYFVPWFFIYSHNNIFQCLFFKLVLSAVHQAHVASLETLLRKLEFIPKAIEHYHEQSGGNRGFILLTLNTLRLGAEARRSAPSDWLRDFLATHQPWLDFAAELRKETLQQLHSTLPTRVDPSPAKQKTLAGPLPALKEYLHLDAQGIDIGSLYAAFLGFLSAAKSESKSADAHATVSNGAGGNVPAATLEGRLVRQGTVTDASPQAPIGRKGLPKLNMGSTPEITATATTAAPGETGKKGLPKLEINPMAGAASASDAPPLSPRSRMGLPKLDLATAGTSPAPEAQGQPGSAGRKVGLPKLDMSAAAAHMAPAVEPSSVTSPTNTTPRGTKKAGMPKLDLVGSGASINSQAATTTTPAPIAAQDDGRTGGGATPRPHLNSGVPGETSPKDYTRAPTPRPHLSGPESPEGTRKPTPRPSWVPKLQLSASDV